jgi:hypothetical protein
MQEIDYQLVENAEELAAACERLARHAEVGFDTETKTCTRCREVKSLNEFSFRSDYPHRRRAECKSCVNGRTLKHYHANREYYAETRRRHRYRIQEMIREAKSKPCADCGQAFPYFVMDFDHRPGEVKVFVISQFTKSHKSQKAVKAEIAKCDVVCANCHRIRTHKRKEGIDEL